MSIGGRTFRAYRPSHFGQQDYLEEEGSEEKQEKIRLYAQRAKAGLPLFESVETIKRLAAEHKFAVT